MRATVAATEPMAEFWPGAATDANFAFRRRADGGYTLAPGMAHDFWIGPAAGAVFGDTPSANSEMSRVVRGGRCPRCRDTELQRCTPKTGSRVPFNIQRRNGSRMVLETLYRGRTLSLRGD